MINTLKRILTEDPDNSVAGHWMENGTYPFFMYNNVVHIGDEKENHLGLANILAWQGVFDKKMLDMYTPDKSQPEKFRNVMGRLRVYKSEAWPDLIRTLPCCGRLWLYDKLMSFWTYPKNKAELNKLLDGLYDKFDIDKTWKIELPKRGLVNIYDYVSPNKTLDKDDEWIRNRMKKHAESPLGKKPGADVQPKKDIPKGWTYAQYHGTVYQEERGSYVEQN